MRSVSWLLVLGIGLACACASERGRPKSDGSNDDDDDTGGSATSTTSSTTGGGGGGGAGSGGASSIPIHCDCLVNAFSAETCTACVALADTGACAADLGACTDDAECEATVMVLLPQCGREAVADKTNCVDQALSIAPASRALVDAYAVCLCAMECSAECGMPVVCTED